MRKIIFILLIVAIMTGCGTQSVSEASNENVRFAGLKGEVTIVTDNQTGCKYIREKVGFSQTQSIALTPLMKADGTADCN